MTTQANADGITYTDSDTATGSIGGTTFSGALVTITFVGDTSNVTGAPGVFFSNTVGTATVTISGIGTFALTTPVFTFDNPRTLAAGITENGDILDTIDSAFGTYDLTTSIGPITGPVLTNLNNPFATSDGALIFSSVGPESTFTATTPEPGSVGFMLLGIGLVVVVLRKRTGAGLSQAS